MHELLKGKGRRDDHCERHGNRQEGGYDHDVEIEVLSQLPNQVVVHRLGQHVHLDDDGNEEHAHQREAERLLVEPDVTEQYLAYHRHNTSGPRNGNRKASKTKDGQVQDRLPNIQEYIRAKRRGSPHENKES